MRYTKLGRTDLNVSRICFGTWQVGGGWGGFDEAEAKPAARRALELGTGILAGDGLRPAAAPNVR